MNSNKRQRPIFFFLGFVSGFLVALFVAVFFIFPRAHEPKEEAQPKHTAEGSELTQTPPQEDDTQIDKKRKKVIKKIRKARRSFLREELMIDEETALKLDEVLEAHDEARLQARKRIRKSRKALAAAIERSIDGHQGDLFPSLIADLLEAEAQAEALRMDVYQDASSVLDQRQLALLHLALPTFERKMNRIIREHREKKGKGKHKKKRKRKGKGPRWKRLLRE